MTAFRDGASYYCEVVAVRLDCGVVISRLLDIPFGLEMP